MKRSYVIAIDGGAATGKTTSAARVAARLGFCYVDSGAVYRAVALALRDRGLTDAQDPRLESFLVGLHLEIDPSQDRFRVMLDGVELGDELRTPEVTALSSKLAVRPEVRETVTALLRSARARGSLVVEGRDIGTVVFPDAALKVFLTTDLDVRAERRRLDLLEQGRRSSVDEVAADLSNRDRRDSTRSASPLRRADDARVIDTSRTGVEEQVEAIVSAFRDLHPSSGSEPNPKTGSEPGPGPGPEPGSNPGPDRGE